MSKKLMNNGLWESSRMMLPIKEKYGDSAILRAVSLTEQGLAKDRAT